MYDAINGHPVKFFIDETNRTVAATIEHCADDVQQYMFDLCGMSIYFPQVPDKTRERIRMPDKLKSYAHCLPEDEFILETGKRIAYDKLRKKYWEKYGRRMLIAGVLLDTFSCALFNAYKEADTICGNIDPLAVLTETTDTPSEGA